MSRFRVAPPYRLALPLVALVLVLAGCGDDNAVTVRGDPPTLPPGQVPTATLDDLRTKLTSISQDECARDDPAGVYPDCGRFVSEVQASLPAVRDRAPSARGVADTVERGIAVFNGSGCLAAPNAGPAGDPARCTEALRTLQQDVRALVAAVR